LIAVVQTAFLLLLFLLCYFSMRFLLVSISVRNTARMRMLYVLNGRLSSRMGSYLSRFNFIYKHLGELLESVRYQVSIGGLLFFMLLLLMAGTVTGYLFFQSMKGMLTLGCCLAFIPYLYLRIRLISQHLKTRLDFLPAVEVFYQSYVLSGGKNIRSVLQDCLAGSRIVHPIRPVFEKLVRSLSTGRDIDECLRIFILSLGHVWAEYFANMVRVGLMEGNDITHNVKDLVDDMRKAQLFDHQERNRLLEIRIASFSPLLFLALFLFINFKFNPANAYRYYVVDPLGRGMLLDSFLFIFGAFIMGVFLSMRRM
jgi:Flp pilus assembly protein TadB